MAWKAIIVEDEELLREGMAEFMDWESMGFTIEGTAENGAAGLKLAERVHPDVVLTDIRMPVMDGLAMLDELRKINPDILAAVISGYDEFDYARGAMRLGVEDYLLKPIQPEQVEQIMKKMAGKLEARQKERMQQEQLLKIKEHSVGEMIRQWIEAKLFDTRLSGRIDEMLQLAGWNPGSRAFLVGIVEWKDFSSRSLDCDFMQVMELDQQFRDEFEKRTAKFEAAGADGAENGSREEEVYIYFRGSGEAVVVCCTETIEQAEALCAQLSGAVESRNALQMQFFRSFGSAGIGTAGLQESRKAAERIRETEYLELWQEIGRDRGQKAEKVKFLDYDLTPMLNAVRDGDRAKLDREFVRFEQGIEQEKIQSKVHLLYVVSGLFAHITRLPNEIGLTFEQTIGDPMEYYSDVVGREHLDEILDRIHDLCGKLTDLFASSGASQAGIALRRALEYIEQSYANSDLLMADVAQHAYISSTYLGILLKKETGKTFVEYLTEYRMQQAKRLLLETELKNYEVAEQCGFSDPTYFSTVFKKVSGMSPSAFRKQEATVSNI